MGAKRRNDFMELVIAGIILVGIVAVYVHDKRNK